MLPLKYLDDNRNLVHFILEKWPHDPDQKDLLNHFRISSNAIYPFLNEGATEILRFSPVSEKTESLIAGEIGFVEYLSLQGVSVPEFRSNHMKTQIASHEFEQEKYISIVMKCVSGTRLDKYHLSNDVLHKYGETLALIHQYSKQLQVPLNRPTLETAYTFIDQHLALYPRAIEVLYQLKQLFKTLKIDIGAFGLIHYDYELDNAFFDDTNDLISVIDFDDAMYHFYAMDVVKSVENLLEHGLELEVSEAEIKNWVNCFLDGYRSIHPIPPYYHSHYNAFKTFMDLYACARMAYSLESKNYRNEDWAKNLIQHFENEIENILASPLNVH